MSAHREILLSVDTCHVQRFRLAQELSATPRWDATVRAIEIPVWARIRPRVAQPQCRRERLMLLTRTAARHRG